MSVELGQVVNYKGRSALVVRIIDASCSFFEEHDGTCYVVREAYAELKLDNGDIAFLEFYSQVIPTEKPQSKIHGLDPVLWRPRNVKRQIKNFQNDGSTVVSTGHSDGVVDRGTSSQSGVVDSSGGPEPS